MKTLNKTFLKTIQIFVIIFALSFSSNINATTSVSANAISTNVVSTSTNVLSTNLFATATAQYALTWGWIKDLIKAISGGGFGSGHTHSQGCGHSGGGDSVPLDGGLAVLLFGAAAFGVKKLRKKNNDKI